MNHYILILCQTNDMEDKLKDIYIHTVQSINEEEAVVKFVTEVDYVVIIDYLSVLNYHSNLFDNFDIKIQDIVKKFEQDIYDNEWFNNNIKLISDLIYTHMNDELIRIICV